MCYNVCTCVHVCMGGPYLSGWGCGLVTTGLELFTDFLVAKNTSHIISCDISILIGLIKQKMTLR